MSYLDIVVALPSLIALEVILCLDNLLFLNILTAHLAPEERPRARYWGLGFAWITRLLLLVFALNLLSLQAPLFTWHALTLSVRSLFLGIGGVFLTSKAIQEIQQELYPKIELPKKRQARLFWRVVMQIALMDMIFSLDSVFTAVGLTQVFWIMALAITIAMLLMMYVSGPMTHWITRYPTIKMLGLCFLLLIGLLLIADALALDIPRHYIYLAMLCAVAVESWHKKISRR